MSSYVDMDYRRHKHDKSKQATSPSTPSPQSTQSDYMDMNFSARRNASRSQTLNVQYSASPVTSSISPKNFDSFPSSIEYIDADVPPSNNVPHESSKRRENDGYVEMTLGPKREEPAHVRQLSLDGASSDYTCMSGSKRTGNQRSQPIQIQTTLSQYAKFSNSTSSTVSTLFNGFRKSSTGTPPKMFLPITSPFGSSLPRPARSRKNSRKDSRDSSSSSVTTPSSSSTLFPMSLSPSSPVGGKAQIDSTFRVPPISNDDYAYMGFNNRAAKPETDYVNYNPSSKSLNRTDAGSYAVMKPGIPSNVLTGMSVFTNVLVSPPTTSFCDAKGFRPISEQSEGSASPRSDHVVDDGCDVKDASKPNLQDRSSRPGSVSSETTLSSLSRPESTTSELGSATSTLVGSRPSSVNSDRRPSSLCSELCYASLDLVKSNEEDGHRSPRTVKPNDPATSQEQSQPAFSYAQIDFVKSEGLKQCPPATNTKVNH